ncbi:MAG: hypothetical protein AB8G17_13435 [Gammaproteobacteria bacterium]
MNQNKIVKGKRPEFYSTPGVNLLMHMVMVLAQEHSAMRDRLDTIERLGAQKQAITPENIDAFVPDQPTLEERETRRQTFLENLFSVMAQQAAEVEKQDTKERFESVITGLAT